MNKESHIRNHRVRAIIIKDNKLLSIKRVKEDCAYFVFPGGKVELTEDFETALKRECQEELGVEVEVGEKLATKRFDREEIKQLEHFYFCKILSGKLGTGDGPEYNINSGYDGSHEIEWLKLEEIDKYDLRPRELALEIVESLPMLHIDKN